jgi:hypothetical protein
MKAMLGISLYSYPYLNQQKRFVLIIVSTLSPIKLEIRAKQFLPGSEGVGVERERGEGKGGTGGRGEK